MKRTSKPWPKSTRSTPLSHSPRLHQYLAKDPASVPWETYRTLRSIPVFGASGQTVTVFGLHLTDFFGAHVSAPWQQFSVRKSMR